MNPDRIRTDLKRAVEHMDNDRADISAQKRNAPQKYAFRTYFCLPRVEKQRCLHRGWQCSILSSRRPTCIDGPERETQWMLALVTVAVVALLQLHRFVLAVLSYRKHRTTGEHLAREILIAMLTVAGIVIFWRDIRRCATYEGILKLIAVVGLVNILLPCLWLVPPPPPPTDHQSPPVVDSIH